MCLAGILGMPVAGLCAPNAAHAPLSTTDTPTHPGLKSGDAATQRSYGDEPGDSSVHAHHGDGMPADGNPAVPSQPSTDTHGSIRTRITARSAVLDTLGVAHDSADQGGSDAQGLGLTVRPLTIAERQTLGLDSGLLVTGVTAGMGLKAGFQPGDVVLTLDGVGLTSTDQFLKLTQKLPHDRPVPVLVHRPNSNLFLPLGAPSRR
ncbi:MAG TPA: PDZ domain-containing protein [Gammaproteobacteria bacterium]